MQYMWFFCFGNYIKFIHILIHHGTEKSQFYENWIYIEKFFFCLQIYYLIFYLIYIYILSDFFFRHKIYKNFVIVYFSGIIRKSCTVNTNCHCCSGGNFISTCSANCSIYHITCSTCRTWISQFGCNGNSAWNFSLHVIQAKNIDNEILGKDLKTMLTK